MKTKGILLFSTAMLCFFAAFILVAATGKRAAKPKQTDSVQHVILPKEPQTSALQKKIEQKDTENQALTDTISQNIAGLGKLSLSAGEANATALTTNKLLKRAARTSKDVPAIERVYRIDTSPRPVVINIVNPYPAPAAAYPKRRHLLPW